MSAVRIGIVGYGHLGIFLADYILQDPTKSMELAFVWNRTFSAVTNDSRVAAVGLENLDDFVSRKADVIVEVCHPAVVAKYIDQWLLHAHVMIGSLTAFADEEVLKRMQSVLQTKKELCQFHPRRSILGGRGCPENVATRNTQEIANYNEKTSQIAHKIGSPVS
eukprot:PhF_6_TR33820/c0_g1_i2/m.49598/K06989/nadX; aspartate dehydrogenase